MTSNYERAVAAAYKMRRMFDTGTLWFDPFLPMSILPDLRVCKYSTFCARHSIRIEDLIDAVSPDGFTLRRGKNYIIVYNDSPQIGAGRRRFTLAHELGHYELGHHSRTDAEEREADCFARNLLAPRLLAIAYDIDFPQYSEVFGISAAAARMCELRRMDDERLARKLRK